MGVLAIGISRKQPMVFILNRIQNAGVILEQERRSRCVFFIFPTFISENSFIIIL